MSADTLFAQCSLRGTETTSVMKDRLQDLEVLAGHNTGAGHDEVDAKGRRGTSQWYDGTVSETSNLLVNGKPSPDAALKFMLKLKLQRRGSRKVRGTDDRALVDLKNQVKIILRDVSEIRDNTNNIAALHTSALMSLSISEDIRAQMKELEDKTRSASARVCAHLKDAEKADAPSTGGALRRMREVQVGGARRAYTAAMERHERELQRYADGLRHLVTQQMKIVRDEACESGELDSYIDGGRTQIFVDNYQSREQEARLALQAVSERHGELSRIERSIVELRDLFVHMASLIAEQGDVVDNIEAHVLAAAEEVAEGEQQLRSAKKKQSSARKKKMWLAGIGAGVTTALVVTVALL